MSRLNGLRLITLDLVGTVYEFARPSYSVYSEFASRRFQNVEEHRVKQGFVRALRKLNTERPHFGAFEKDGSRGWWVALVQETFRDALDSRHSPKEILPLAEELVDFFASKEAYLVYPDALAFLRSLSKDQELRSRVKLGVITNNGSNAFKALESLEIRKYFDFAVCSETAKSSKPDPSIFQHALKKAGLPTASPGAEILHIGDDLNKDYLGAKAVGWNAMILDRSINKVLQGNNCVRGQDICRDFNEVLNKLRS